MKQGLLINEEWMPSGVLDSEIQTNGVTLEGGINTA